jgi:hypothetical protein
MSSTPANPPSSTTNRPSVRLATDAVVASYIHAISERHVAGDPISEPEQDHTPQD